MEGQTTVSSYGKNKLRSVPCGFLTVQNAGKGLHDKNSLTKF